MEPFSFNMLLAVFIIGVQFFWLLLKGMVEAMLPWTCGTTKPLVRETALITDASKGIGRKLAIELAKMGNTVVLWDSDSDALQKTAEEIREAGGSVHSYQVDLSDHESVIAAAILVKEQVSTPVSLLINNTNLMIKKVVDEHHPNFTSSNTEKLMNVNIMSHFWIIQEFLPSMCKKGQGHLVGLSHIPDDVGKVHTVDYAASKSAVSGLMGSMSEMLAETKKEVACTTVFIRESDKQTKSLLNSEMMRSFLGPIKQEDMVKSIIRAIQTNQSVVYLPKINYYWKSLKQVLPTQAYKFLRGQFLNRMAGKPGKHVKPGKVSSEDMIDEVGKGTEAGAAEKSPSATSQTDAGENVTEVEVH